MAKLSSCVMPRPLHFLLVTNQNIKYPDTYVLVSKYINTQISLVDGRNLLGVTLVCHWCIGLIYTARVHFELMRSRFNGGTLRLLRRLRHILPYQIEVHRSHQCLLILQGMVFIAPPSNTLYNPLLC